MSSRSSKVVYSIKEKTLLAALVERFKDQLENKKTDGSSNAAKSESWAEITAQYNSHDVIKRTTAQLKKCCENMKYKNKKTNTQNKYHALTESMAIIDEEKELRKKKLNEAIEHQREFYKARMETVELEKAYWRKKADLS